MTYLNRYLKKNCSSDLQSLFSQSVNPEKEISESYAAYANLKPFIKNDDTNICIGDGSLGMTGALLAFVTTGWSIIIDPLLRTDKLVKWRDQVKAKRILLCKQKFENIEFDSPTFPDYNLILVHSHVDTSEVMKKYPNWKYCYVNPCCKPKSQKLSVEFQKQNNISVVACGVDTNILSEKNEIIIYRNDKWKIT